MGRERPRAILDMGCAIGNSTLEWARAFPDAEVHGIDVAAPVLRYAHARAEALGAVAHFSQQNAEHTNFDSASFDLVISHIVLHETSKSALGNVLAESRRLLKPGGIMLHLEIPRGDSPFEKFMYNWETYNNNETFAGFMTDLDLAGESVKAGFSPQRTRVEAYAPPMSAEQRKLLGRVLLEDSGWRTLMEKANEPGRNRVARVAKGKKPQYFSDPAVDKLLSITLTLASELSVSRDRLDAVERLLERRGVLTVADVDRFEPDPQSETLREARRASYLERVLRAVQAELEEVSRPDMPRSAEDVVAAVSS